MFFKIKGLSIGGIVLSLLFAHAVYAQNINIIDDNGHHLTFKSPPARIVSLAPHATELLFAVGAGKQLVALDNWSNFPAQAQHLPRVGDMNTLHFERILAHRPDLVVVWEATQQSRQAWRLRHLGLPVFVSSPKNFADIRRNAEMFAKISRQANIAHHALHQFTQQLQELERQKPTANDKLSVFIQISTQPLISVGGGQFISQALEYCQAENIFKDQKLMSFPVQKEQVIARAPDVILYFEDAPQTPEFWAFLGERTPKFISIHADKLARPSLRLVEGTAQICQDLNQIRQSQHHKTLKATPPKSSNLR